ncbi:MAG TPA: hypothetical protein VFJ91_00895, partial [Gaiellaceae bacterium]|nr:hypothetical protein [Gaiellaceae bacterium]
AAESLLAREGLRGRAFTLSFELGYRWGHRSGLMVWSSSARDDLDALSENYRRLSRNETAAGEVLADATVAALGGEIGDTVRTPASSTVDETFAEILPHMEAQVGANAADRPGLLRTFHLGAAFYAADSAILLHDAYSSRGQDTSGHGGFFGRLRRRQ